MNKRFEELARQSGALPTQDCGVPQWYIDEDDLEKFAELIIRECISMCSTAVGNRDYNTGRLHCVENIKEHFGVE
jgi:hypothetical protein